MSFVNKGFYVYIHFDLVNHLVFYVGKGSKNRAQVKIGRNDIWYEYVKLINNEYNVIEIKSNLSEFEAFELEQLIINKFGSIYLGGTLTNKQGFDVDLRLFKDLPEINLNDSSKSTKYTDYTNDMMIEDILSFPKFSQCSNYEKSFEAIYDSFDNSIEKLNDDDDELCFEIEMVYDDLIDLIFEYKHNSIEQLDFFEGISLLNQDLANIRLDFNKRITSLFNKNIQLIEGLIAEIIKNEDVSTQ